MLLGGLFDRIDQMLDINAESNGRLDLSHLGQLQRAASGGI